MSDDRREERRSRQGETSNRSEDRPSNGRSTRQSGRDSRARSNDRKSGRDDGQSSRNGHKSSRDDDRNDRKSSRDDDRNDRKSSRDDDRNDRKSSRDDDRNDRKSSRDDREPSRSQSRKEDRKSGRDEGNDREDRKSRSSRNGNDKQKIDYNTDEMVEANSELAEIAEQTCRYGDCLTFLSEVVRARKCLSYKQRDMFWSSFRNRTSAKRNSWRKSLELERNSNKKETEVSAVEYRNKLSTKITANCKSILTLVEDYLIPHLEDSSRKEEKDDIEARIFYLKVKGDANRYMWEISDDKQDRKRYEDEALKAYERAYDKAVKDLGPATPLRLGLALNYSVLHFEVLDNKDKARNLAKKASDDAQPEVEKLENDDKLASESIIASLEHNIHLWKDNKD